MEECHPTCQDFWEVIVSIRALKWITLRGNAGRGLGASRAHRGLVAGFFLGLSFVLVPDALAQKLPTGGVQYPFEFHCVNDKAINAFALPGGYVFVNRGAIEASDNEAQLSGVLAHELSHVALRHGT